MYALIKNLRYQDHTRRYSIATTPTGWEVREEVDSEVVRREQYRDWHRVERARRSIDTRMQDLRQQGWAEAES